MARAMKSANANHAEPFSHGIAGQTRQLVRVGWWAVAAMFAGSFAIALVARFDQLRQPCTATNPNQECGYYALSPVQAEHLNEIGLNLNIYGTYQVVLDSVPALAYLALGIFITRRQPDDLVASLMSLGMIATGLIIIPEIIPALEHAFPSVGTVWLAILYFLAMPLFVYVIATIPNGRFQPRWILSVGVVMVVSNMFAILLELFSGYSTGELPGAAFVAVGLLAWISIVGGQIYRYRRTFSQTERQQMKWVFFGLIGFASGGLAWALIFDQQVLGTETTQLWLNLLALPALLLLALVLPLSMSFAILRYRLYDIDVILNRTVVYLLLTAVVIATYVLIVGGLGAIIRGHSDSWLPFFAVGVIAILLQLLRDRIQHRANRLMFGARDDPYAVLTTLGHDLSATTPPDAALQRTVETIVSTLKLPYAAIDLREESGFITSASSGKPLAEPDSIPMVYHGEAVGRLLVSPRSTSEPFTDKERRLLEDIAVHAGAVASSVQFTRALQAAREHLVFAREEERRRIRRDLHDGLGPTLATQTLYLDAAIDLLPDDPTLAQEALQAIKQQNSALIGDIRRLVYQLRPPALDELHLVGAIQSHAAQIADKPGLGITVRAEPEPFPEMPAAVEVAIFRVVEEALTNVVRHGNADECRISLNLVANSPVTLHLEISDDGVGLPDRPNPGIGLRSMRDRIEELGGEFDIARLPAGGTRIVASIQLGESDLKGIGAGR